MKRLFVILFCITLLFLSAKPASAQSSYVLPYPSTMPGSKLYKVHVVFEELSKFWYFGNLGQFAYNVNLSDKYLVEAKTLFEYKQYLLAIAALKKSDDYFEKARPNLEKARAEGKDISSKETILKSASAKHQEVLHGLLKEVPAEFLWEPEKQSSTKLLLHENLQKSILLRSNI